MEVTDEVHGKATVVIAKGRLDSNTSKLLETRLTELASVPAAALVVDLGQVDYVSSAGLRVLLIAVKKVKGGGGKLALCAIQPQVREVFDISGLSAVFSIHPERSASIQAVGG
jgi:anti-sigma B factor antagonist